ncbi:hypothetical protein A1O1_08588 [Capronia coronata CBS 617.96]|uniref:Zn(2)-C6 fungal-type domain-containing protein n=1 Tax=Capronia coronata CBS 617.96 TaxID=1182541 RepID=W9XJT2_9EURO|nr:uncharacterized protein A1O1_08588 [Capronia coronata CBS 617.96]EXJ80443.1 hypothetical protein A1O1_08588 [Capronia coronata CBS 617.96]
MVQSERPRRKRQQKKACDTCRRRKVACDVIDEYPCTTCKRSRLECRSTASWHRNESQDKGREECSPASSTGVARVDRPASSPASMSRGDQAPLEGRKLVSDNYNVLHGLTKESLTQFFQHGVDTTEWLVFDNNGDHVRLAYIGTPASNLTHLVNLKKPTRPTLHYPFPPIRSPLPWKPNTIWNLRGNIDIADDISCFPSKEARDALVEAYFTRIHPSFPIIEEAKFRRQYEDPDMPPPLLLFQAVLLAGAHVCDHPLVAESRAVVKGTLFRRASLLFHIRHENDRLHLMQAAMLFTWHLENADTVTSGSYYWLGVACRIGFGMGVHRDVSHGAATRLPQWERRLYRRVWWTIFQAETFSALDHGRPCMINIRDTDQPPLKIDDFLEGDRQLPNAQVSFEFCAKNVKLCFIILDILDMTRPQGSGSGPDAASVSLALAQWALDLPQGDDFLSCQLRLHYNLIQLHLHRNLVDSADSRDICIEATQAIISLFELMISQGTIGRCYFTANMAITAAAIHTANIIKMALDKSSTLVATNAHNQLSRLLRCATELAKYWPNVGAVNALFEGLLSDLRTLIVSGVQGQAEDTRLNGQQTLQTDTNWQNIFETLNFSQTPDYMGREWMNTADWLAE